MDEQPGAGGQVVLTDANLPEYLQKIRLVGPGEAVRVEPAGEGNINWVRRARSGERSWVVKQARPALERFPAYRVSTQRLLCEARYYETVARFDRDGVCPRIVLCDPEQRVLVLEDLGSPPHLEDALARGDDVAPVARILARFLGTVHAGTRGGELAGRFENAEMQQLHGDHIFLLPYRENDFPLSPALAGRAAALRADASLLAQIDAAHARYRDARRALVHGDVQPGNVLLAESGPRLLDAEIAHLGDPAFDLGILVAHLFVHAIARGEPQAARGAVASAWSAYADAHGRGGLCAFAEVARYAGIELMRRSIGAARVPAVERDEAALAVVAAGAQLVADPPDAP